MKYVLLFLLAFFFGTIAMKVFAADLPPIIKYGVNPPKYQPELCLETGKSFVGQVLKPDKTCRSGFRWVYGE